MMAQRSYSSLPGVEMPPASKFGLPLLAKFDQPGYTVTALPDKKKQRGFRIADAEGNTTDFYLDAATGRVMTFLIPYNGYTFGTENKKFKEIEGVLVPIEFTQRLEMPQGAFFAEYKVKDVKAQSSAGRRRLRDAELISSPSLSAQYVRPLRKGRPSLIR